MKPIILAIATLVILGSCNKSKDNTSFIIEGKVEHPEDGFIYIQESTDNKIVKIDSVKPQGKNFQFKVASKENTFYQINFFGKQFGLFVAGPGDELSIEAEGNRPNGLYKVTGSKDNDFLMIADNRVKAFQEKVGILRSEFEQKAASGDTTGQGTIFGKYEALTKQHILNSKKLIDSAGTSIVSISLATNFLDINEHFGFMDTLAQKFVKELPNSKYTKKFADMINKKKNVGQGQVAPDFELATPTGEFIKLSSLRGKIVLLDFWASWCGPCRAENPNVVKIYNTYKSKGFEILGVSLDEDNADWEAAIKKDNLTWKHVSDLKGWESAVAKLYQVEGIPATFILDKEGKIVAKNLRGAELEAKVKSLL